MLLNTFTQTINQALVDWAIMAQKIVDEIPENMTEQESEEWALARYRELLDDGLSPHQEES